MNFNRKKLTGFIFTLLLVISMLTGCMQDITTEIFTVKQTATVETKASAKDISLSGNTSLKVHFIDIGQGDSILAESEGHYMLVDAGENNKGEIVSDYLKGLGITKLDYVIGTHPHSDHIGGLDTVIDSFDIGKVILPPKEHTTKTFESLLDSIENKSLKITMPEVGDTYTLGSASFVIIAPNDDYKDDLNNWSVGVKIIAGDTSFVMCGDAEREAEQDISENGIDISADVLKAGHHGSRTSSSDIFLDAVNPEYAVISCGDDNSYGHPHDEILSLFKSRGIKVFRTDTQGTIIASSDGSSVDFNVLPYEE